MRLPVVCQMCRARTPHRFFDCDHPCQELVKFYADKAKRSFDREVRSHPDLADDGDEPQGVS